MSTREYTYTELFRAADKLFANPEAVLDNPTDEQLAMILAVAGRKRPVTTAVVQNATSKVIVAYIPVF